MGFHSPLIRPAIFWGGYLRFPWQFIRKHPFLHGRCSGLPPCEFTSSVVFWPNLNPVYIWWYLFKDEQLAGSQKIQPRPVQVFCSPGFSPSFLYTSPPNPQPSTPTSGQGKFQGPSIVGSPFPHYSNKNPIRSMGTVWEADYAKGITLLGCQEVSKRLGSVGNNPNIPHSWVGYNPFTNHLLTSWDIQVGVPGEIHKTLPGAGPAFSLPDPAWLRAPPLPKIPSVAPGEDEYLLVKYRVLHLGCCYDTNQSTKSMEWYIHHLQ